MTADIATLGIRVDARQVEQGDRALQNFQRSGDRAEQSADRLQGTMARLARMAAAVTAALGVHELIKQADLWANLQGRLSLVTKSQQDLVDKQNALFAVAQRTRSQLEGTVDLYAKLTRATQSLNTTDAERLRVTETINKSMIISGAGAEEAAGAVRQLGQAFAAGALRGDELNSILEGAPRLAEAIAVGMGRTVGDLKTLGEQGKITGAAVMKALNSQAGAIDAEFAKMPQTVGQAFTQIQNAVLRYIGVTDQAGKMSAGLAGMLSTVAGNIGKVAAAIAGLAATGALNWFVGITRAIAGKVAATEAAIVADRTAAVAAIAAAEAANLQATAELRLAEVEAAGALGAAARTASQARLTAATLAQTAATTALTAAQTAGAGVAGWGARALGLLGGPIGIVTTLLGAGVAAWMMWGDKAKEGETKAEQSLSEKTIEIVADLDKQIAKLEERNRLMKVAPDVAKAEAPGAEQQRAILTEIDRVSKDANLTDLARTEILRVLGGQYNELTVKMGRAAAAQKTFDATSNADKLSAWLAKNTEYLTKAEKITAAIAKAKQELGDAFNADVEKKIRDSFAKGDVEKATNAYKESVKAAKEYIRSLELERQEVGATEQQKRMLAAAREAEKVKAGPDAAAVRLRIMEEALALDAATQAWERKVEAEKAAAELQAKVFDDPTAAVWKQVEALKAENAAFGLTAEAATRAAIVKVQAALQSVELTDRETSALESQLAALNALADEQARHAGLEAGKKAADDAKAEALKMSDDIRNSLTDALLRGFEAGKGFAQNLRDTTVHMFETMVLRPVIQGVMSPVSQAIGSAFGPSTAAAAGSSAGGSALGSAAAGLFGAGGLGGSIAAGAGWLTGATTLTGSLTAGASLMGTGTLAGMASGLGMMAGALGPIALGVAAIYALTKSIDHSGTPHTGGAASASASGTQAIAAESLHFEKTQVSASTQEWVTGVASGVVGILNATATAFGKTAGYEAATAFADDSSKDGAWGGLVIKNLGSKLLDWQDSRGNGPWAPKVFADGEVGQKQYLAEISKSVRTVMDGIGLPSWAGKMLDALGDAPALDELAKVVDTITATQNALAVLGQNIAGFASLSDGAVAALMDASGGIAALSTNAGAFYANFYSEGEKNAAMSGQITDALAAVNLAMPATRDGYRDLVTAQMQLGEAGAPALAVLFQNAAAFAQITPAATEAAAAVRSAADVLSERDGLLDQLAQITMTPDAYARSKLDSRNLDVYGQVQAAQAAKDAADALAQANDGIQQQIDALLRARMSEAEGYAADTAGMAESTRALYDHMLALKAEDAAAAAAQAASEQAAAAWAQRQADIAAADVAAQQQREAAAAAEAQAAQALATKRADLELQLFNLTHDAAEQLAHKRELEIAATEGTLEPLQRQIYAMEDQAAAADQAAKDLAAATAHAQAVANERTSLDRSYYQAVGDTAKLREMELAALDPSNRARQEEIYAIQDKAVADQKAAAAAQAFGEAQVQVVLNAQKAADDLKQAWRDIGNSLVDEINRIHGVMGGDSAASAQMQFAVATAQARAGDQAAAKMLPALSQKLLEAFDSEAVTALDLRRLQAMTAASLGDTVRAIAPDTPGYTASTSSQPAAAQSGDSGPTVAAAVSSLSAEIADLKRENKRLADMFESLTNGGDAMRVTTDG